MTPGVSSLSSVVSKVTDDVLELHALGSQIVATLEVNLDMGQIVSQGDNELRRLICAWKERLAKHDPERLVPDILRLSRPTGVQVEQNSEAATGELPSLEPNRH